MSTCVPSASQIGSARELYVADVFEIAGDDAREDALFSFAAAHRITRLTIYGHRVLLLDTPDGAARLERFVRHARARGIRTLSATIGWDAELDSLVDYMRATPSASFDELVTELEYWHDCGLVPRADDGVIRPCFAPMRAMLDRLTQTRDALVANGHPPITLASYLGWPTRDEARAIASSVQRVLLHAEQPTPERAYAYAELAGGTAPARLRDFAGHADVWPIFYARGEADMSAWMATHDLASIEHDWTAPLLRERDTWACDVRIGGFTYFDYRSLAAAQQRQLHLPPLHPQ